VWMTGGFGSLRKRADSRGLGQRGGRRGWVDTERVELIPASPGCVFIGPVRAVEQKVLAVFGCFDQQARVKDGKRQYSMPPIQRAVQGGVIFQPQVAANPPDMDGHKKIDFLNVIKWIICPNKGSEKRIV